MRPCEQTEILQWFQYDINNLGIYTTDTNPEGRSWNSNNSSDLTANAYLEVTCYDEDWNLVTGTATGTNGDRIGRLFDWTNNLGRFCCSTYLGIWWGNLD